MPYNRVFTFGDSLVDSGNALDLAQWYDGLPFTDLPDGAPTTELGYFKGRFSDGYTFVDLISNKAVGVVTKPVFPYHFEDPWLGVPIAPFESDPNGISLNFAYGGAHIRQGDEVVPDLDDQTDAFRDAVDGDAPSSALYLITTGGNDIRDLAPTGSNPVLQAEAYEELQRCADKLLHELSQLVDDGAVNIVITGIPDVGLIPHYDRDGDGVLNATEQMRSDAATDYSIHLDTLIRNEVVPALEALGANVTYVPVMDYVDGNGQLVTGALSAILPTIAALHGLTTEELSNNLLQHKELIFFDNVHPNAQAHALVGSYMQAMIAGTPWIETLPLTSAEVDYRLTGSITVSGEVDQLVIAMVAGTTYTFDMLGVSSLGTGSSLADPSLRLLGPAGGVVAFDDDSGAGFDATISFAAAGTANHTLQMLAVGSVTGAYLLQAALVGGAAMQAGNVYTVDNGSILVLEGAGGIGEDVIKTSASYALSAGSEIEVLRTANDQGKTVINLAGNEFGQTLIGNAGANILDGNGGSDTLMGGGGKDIFILAPGPVDHIADYAKGELVDVTQFLSVAAGTNVSSGGHLRVTRDGLVQVDLDGGGNDWSTVGTVNGTSAVTFRYLSGGVATNVTLSRVAAGANAATASAIAAAGLMASPATAASQADDIASLSALTVTDQGRLVPQHGNDGLNGALVGEMQSATQASATAAQDWLAGGRPSNFVEGQGSDSFDPIATHALPALPDEIGSFTPEPHIDLVARSISMPSAAMLAPQEQAPAANEIGEIFAEALASPATTVDDLLDTLFPNVEVAAMPAVDWADLAGSEPASTAVGEHLLAAAMQLLAVHQDAFVPA